MDIDSFFQPGDSTDVAYCNLRDHDHPRHLQVRRYCDELWRSFRRLADSHFLEDAKNHFQQRFWEMYLGCALLDWGLDVRSGGGAGPDFYIADGDRRTWIEATAPLAGTGPDAVPDLIDGQARHVPTDQITLRYTAAAAAKAEQFARAKRGGQVREDDQYILAINCASIPAAKYGDTMPYFIRAFLPIGRLRIAIDPKTNSVVAQEYEYRPSLQKASGSSVSTTRLLDGTLPQCAGILHSGVDCVNHPNSLGGDFTFLYAPDLAPAPSVEEIGKRCLRYYWRGDHLERLPPDGARTPQHDNLFD